MGFDPSRRIRRKRLTRRSELIFFSASMLLIAALLAWGLFG